MISEDDVDQALSPGESEGESGESVEPPYRDDVPDDDEWDEEEDEEEEEEEQKPWNATARELSQCFAADSRRLARNMMLRYKQHLKPHRITVTELHVLVEVALKRNVTAAALSQALELDKSTVSRTIERLYEKEWLMLGASRDARLLPLELYLGAEKRLEAALKAWSEAHHSVMGWLGEDATALQRLARRLRPPPRERNGAIRARSAWR